MVVAHQNKEFPMKLNLSEASKVGYKDLDLVNKSIAEGKAGLSKVVTPNGSTEIKNLSVICREA